MSTRTRWALTADGFERLLESLGDDRQAASRDPEALADVTLDRAAKRLAEGERIENLRAWLRVAAKRVLQESYLTQTRERTGAREALRFTEVATGAESDHACLQNCMSRISAENAALLARYYGAGGERLIPARKQLAQELGISIETLRTRALRLRKSLERCMLQCRESRETKLT